MGSLRGLYLIHQTYTWENIHSKRRREGNLTRLLEIRNIVYEDYTGILWNLLIVSGRGSG